MEHVAMAVFFSCINNNGNLLDYHQFSPKLPNYLPLTNLLFTELPPTGFVFRAATNVIKATPITLAINRELPIMSCCNRKSCTTSSLDFYCIVR
jgi:hypothetical protein